RSGLALAMRESYGTLPAPASAKARGTAPPDSALDLLAQLLDRLAQLAARLAAVLARLAVRALLGAFLLELGVVRADAGRLLHAPLQVLGLALHLVFIHSVPPAGTSAASVPLLTRRARRGAVARPPLRSAGSGSRSAGGGCRGAGAPRGWRSSGD